MTGLTSGPGSNCRQRDPLNYRQAATVAPPSDTTYILVRIVQAVPSSESLHSGLKKTGNFKQTTRPPRRIGSTRAGTPGRQRLAVSNRWVSRRLLPSRPYEAPCLTGEPAMLFDQHAQFNRVNRTQLNKERSIALLPSSIVYQSYPTGIATPARLEKEYRHALHASFLHTLATPCGHQTSFRKTTTTMESRPSNCTCMRHSAANAEQWIHRTMNRWTR